MVTSTFEAILTSKPEVQKMVNEFVATHGQRSLEPEPFARLRGRLADSGVVLTEKGLISLVRKKLKAREEAEYQDFRSQILSTAPATKEQFFERYLCCYGGDTSRVPFLQRLLQEYGSPTSDLEQELKLFELQSMKVFLVTDMSQAPPALGYIDIMHHQTFEYYIAALFRNVGFTAEVTPRSREKGADVILTGGNLKIVVQAKHHGEGKKVGLKAVQEVYGALNVYNADRGWVVTNRFFTRDAIDLAHSNNVRLIDRHELHKLVMMYDPLRLNAAQEGLKFRLELV